MKNFTFTLIFVLASLLMSAQQVQRDKVIVEIGTGTWCPYCPGAALGADDLIANGCQVAVIEYHDEDAFTNDASNARIAYYSIAGFPTAFFDGTLSFVGGDHTQSMYPNYLPLYQQRYAIPSSFTIQVYGEHTGDNYDIVLLITRVATTTQNIFKAQLVLTESNIVYSWQGQNELNYVERTMVPDAQGTEIDFTNDNTVMLELSFTKDASWVADNCELVSFLQDDVTKEIFQGTKIALNNLQPMPALARFTASSTLPCINNDVDFYDNSLGQIISWNWTFEGGNPPTSTLQDPVVTYATPGQYDVQLIVYDGDVYDTMLTNNYIEAITIPPQPSTPVGETELCQGTGDVVYTTTALPHATSYLWQVSPSTAGTITGTGTEGTFSLDQGYLGSFTVRVRADNDCGTGTFSQNLNVTAYYSPFEYTLSDGGGYCEGGEGIEVTQDGSEADVNYELFVNGISTGQTLPGTGSPLDFGLQTTEGIYTCTGSNDHCTTGMIGNTYIFVIHQVGTTAAPGGSAMECNYNVGTPYNTAGAPHATYYIWTLNPAEAGTINGSTSTATVDWNTSYTGMASINVQGANSCGVGIVSPDLDVYVYAAPQPEISGESSVCNNDLGVLYSTPENTGSNYEWQISGGTIASGAGTHEVSVNWGAPGSGYLAVTELTAQGCSSTTDNFDVTIEDCTGIGELANMPWRIFPNPVNGLLNIEVGLQKDQVLQVNILNLLGQSVYQLAGLTGNGLKKIQVNTTGFKEGVYTVQIRSANGSVVEKKFVKLD